MCGFSRDTHRLGAERGRGRNDDTTAAAQFDRGDEIVGFKGGGYKGSWPWCSLIVGLSSLLLVAPSGEQQLALPVLCWRGTSPSTIFRVFGPMLFSGQSVVVDLEGVGFRPRAFEVGREVVSCSCSSMQHAHF